MIGRPDALRMIEWPELHGWLIECPELIVIESAWTGLCPNSWQGPGSCVPGASWMIGRPDALRMIEWPELHGWLIECPELIVIESAWTGSCPNSWQGTGSCVPGASWMIGRPDALRMIEWPELHGWLIECPELIVIESAWTGSCPNSWQGTGSCVPGASWMVRRVPGADRHRECLDWFMSE